MVLQIGADNKIDGDFESWSISWKQIKGNDRSTKDKIAKYLWWENFKYTSYKNVLKHSDCNYKIPMLFTEDWKFTSKTANHTHITWNCQLLYNDKTSLHQKNYEVSETQCS